MKVHDEGNSKGRVGVKEVVGGGAEEGALVVNKGNPNHIKSIVNNNGNLHTVLNTNLAR